MNWLSRLYTRTGLRCPRRRRFSYLAIEGAIPYAVRYLVVDRDGRERGRYDIYWN